VIRIEPFYSIQFMTAIAKVKPLAGALARVVTLTDVGIRFRFAEGEDDPKAFIDRIFESAENGGDVVVDVVSLATGKPKAWFEALPLDGLYDLAMAVWRQNRKQNGDFFVKRLWPQIQGLFMAQAQDGAPSTGD
jgi:hypothetical protein